MYFEELKQNLIGLVKESQLKLGYSDTSCNLYYPAEALNHLLGTELPISQLETALQEFGTYAAEELGIVTFSRKGELFCLTVPKEGAAYVHEHVENNGFLEAFIFYGLLFYTATNLSNKLGAKWENSRLRKKAEKEGMSPAEYAKKDIPKMFLLEIENRSNDRNCLSGYLTMCVKEKIISRAQANAILEDFGKK